MYCKYLNIIRMGFFFSYYDHGRLYSIICLYWNSWLRKRSWEFLVITSCSPSIYLRSYNHSITIYNLLKECILARSQFHCYNWDNYKQNNNMKNYILKEGKGRVLILSLCCYVCGMGGVCEYHCLRFRLKQTKWYV